MKITNAGAVWGTNIVISKTNCITANIAEGTNEWYASAQDKAGNWSGWSSTNMLVIDMTGPMAVLLKTPLNNIITNGISIDFTWQTGSDLLTGITNYRLHITNINAGWGTNIITGLINDTINNLQEGTNLWYAKAQDKAGFWGEWSSTNTLVIDITLPMITLILPASNSAFASVNVAFQWNVSDINDITNQRIEIDIDNNGTWDTIVTTNSPYINTFAGNGTNAWRVWAKDKAGNTNYSSIWKVIVNTNNKIITLIITNIPFYEVTRSAVNCPILAFNYNDSLGGLLQVLRITNLSTNKMQAAQDISRINVYRDSNIPGVFENEPLIGYLEYDINTGKWTNNNIMITNNWDILITIDISANPEKGRTFQAAIVATNDIVSQNTNSKIISFITNKYPVRIDNTPPSFTGEYTIKYLSKTEIELSWSPAVDIVIGNNPITYMIFVSQDKDDFNLSEPAYTNVNSTSIVINDLAAGDTYFLIIAVDNMGNESKNNQTYEPAVIKGYEDDLSKLRIYPIPVYKDQDLKIDGLTQTANIRIYSISGIIVYEEPVIDFHGDPVRIRLSDYNIASGVYIIIISNDKDDQVKRKIVYIKGIKEEE